MVSIAGYLLDRGVDRTYAAPMPHVWEATLATLRRMQVTVEKADRDERQGEIRASAGGMTVAGELTKATEGMTKVSLTVGGGFRPDKETAREILDRIAALLQDEPTELASARAHVRASAGLALATPAAAPASQSATIQKELEALRAELAALREFRATLVREFGGLRSEMAMRLSSPAPGNPSEPEREQRAGSAHPEGASILRVQEMVVKEADLPGSVLVVRMSRVAPEGGREAASLVHRVDSPASISQASGPWRAGSLPGLAHTLRPAGALPTAPSILRPAADLGTEGPGPPAQPGDGSQ
jgi:hypothetical protein